MSSLSILAAGVEGIAILKLFSASFFVKASAFSLEEEFDLMSSKIISFSSAGTKKGSFAFVYF